LAGPAGIAIAVSAVTSALIAFGPQIKNFFNKVSESEQAQRKLNEQLGEERAKLLSLEGAFNATNATRENKLQIIKQLRSDYGPYLKNLSDEQILQRGIGEAIQLSTKAIENRLRASAFEANAAKAITDQLNTRLEIERLGLEIDRERVIQADQAAKQQQAVGKAAELVAAGALASGLRITSLQDKRNALLQKDLELQKQVNDALKASGELRLPDFVQKEKEKNTEKDKTNKLIFQELGLTQLVTRELSAQEQAIKKIVESRQKANETERAKALVDTTSGNQTAPTGLNFGIPKAIVDQAKQNAEIVAANITKIETATVNANAAFSLLGGAIDQAFNALANGQNPIDAVKQAIKQLIVQLAKAVVQAVVLSAVLNAIAPGSSAALGGVGGILKNLLGFRANGGPVGAGNAYLIGERGPELFVPGQNGRIMNNSAMIGAGGMQIIPTLEFSYDNLRIAFNRANASAGRRL
jgi:hypothetical protein